MLGQLQTCKHLIQDWNATLFALYYHDYIYKSTAKDNENLSADVAAEKLFLIGQSAEMISKVTEMILATKGHDVSNNGDTNYFTDSDLSILGSSRDHYVTYANQVRKEYKIYPDILYKPGRKKILNYFQEMVDIFKTDFFQVRFEKSARENIAWELESLS
jgi:predicted metal-dependent HD superfamily phosphohydrolase